MRQGIAWILVLLLGLAMVLQSAVLLLYAFRSSGDTARHVARVLVEHVPLAAGPLPSGEEEALRECGIVALARVGVSGSVGTLLWATGNQGRRLRGSEPAVRSLVREAAREKRAVWMPEGYMLPLVNLLPTHLWLAVPRKEPDSANPVYLVAVLELSAARDQLFGGMTLAVTCLVVNLIVFAVIGFFRLDRLLVQPIEKLASRSEAASLAGEDFSFSDLEARGVLSRLSTGLDAMLARIQRDRAELKKTVRSLERSNRELARTRREAVRVEKLAAIGRLAAGLAHEIGNPLGIVKGYVELLGRPGLTEEERRDFVSRAVKEIDRISRLLRRLMDLSRPARQCRTEIRLHELVVEVVELLQAQPAFRGLDWRLELNATSDLIRGDPDQIKQLLLNCLLNSLDAIVEAGRKEEGGRIRIRTGNSFREQEETGARLSLEITDNGIGIPGEIESSLFDPFVSSKEPGKGTGLGLSVSLAIVEGLGGRMEVTGNGDLAGATVRVDFPLVEARGCDQGSSPKMG